MEGEKGVSINRVAIEELLSRSVDSIYPSREALEKALYSGKKLRLYLGIDPTSPHLHLGHAENIIMLRRFQDLGHEVIVLFGDFTGRIGDPTDKLAARTALTSAQVMENLKTFKAQASKVLRFSGKNAAQVKFNAKWLSKLTFEEIMEVASHFTVQQMIERSMFQERLKAGKPIHLHEFFYPLMQGYDSYAMDVDLEIGGTDQTFNMLVGRDMQRMYRNKEKFVITNRLLEDPATGKKMSKTEGTLINLDDVPEAMFGKMMSAPDELIVPIAELATMIPIKNIEEIKIALKKGMNPRDIKIYVAEELVKLYHSEKLAEKAKEEFVRVFSKKEKPEDAPKLKGKKGITLVDLLMSAGVESKSEARRLIQQGAVKLNDVVMKNEKEEIVYTKGDILRIGKHRFFEME